MNYKKQFSLLIMCLASGLCFAKGGSGTRTGGGPGDFIGPQIAEYGTAIIVDLRAIATMKDDDKGGNIEGDLKVLEEIDISRFSAAVENYKPYGSVHQPFERKRFRKIYHDAMTVRDPDGKHGRIAIYNDAWKAHQEDPIAQIGIVFHEYMRAAGYVKPEDLYKYTKAFVNYVTKNYDSTAVKRAYKNFMPKYQFAKVLHDKKWHCYLWNDQTKAIANKLQYFEISKEELNNGRIFIHLRDSLGALYIGFGKASSLIDESDDPLEIGISNVYVTMSYQDMIVTIPILSELHDSDFGVELDKTTAGNWMSSVLKCKIDDETNH